MAIRHSLPLTHDNGGLSCLGACPERLKQPEPGPAGHWARPSARSLQAYVEGRLLGSCATAGSGRKRHGRF